MENLAMNTFTQPTITSAESNLIDRNELKTRIDRGESLVILEALPERYYQAEHLPGAKLFPMERVDALAAELIAGKGVPVVVYCASLTCQNSHLAARRLRQLGYLDVRVYAGG